MLVLPIQSKAALFTSDTIAKATGNRGGNSPLQKDSFSSASSASALSDNNYEYGLVSSGSSKGKSSVSAGSLKVAAFADVDATFGGVYPTFITDVVRTDAQAQARLNDSFVVHADGIASRTRGTLTVEFEITGSLGSATGSSSHSGLAQWTSFVDLASGIGNARWSGGEFSSYTSATDIIVTKDYETDGNPSSGRHSLALSFMFDVPIRLDIFGEADAWASAGSFCGGTTGYIQCTSSNASAFADLSHTISWRGISSVVDQNGTAINNFTGFSADTHFNYAASAVPLPNTLIMFATGIGFFFLSKRELA